MNKKIYIKQSVNFANAKACHWWWFSWGGRVIIGTPQKPQVWTLANKTFKIIFSQNKKSVFFLLINLRKNTSLFESRTTNLVVWESTFFSIRVWSLTLKMEQDWFAGGLISYLSQLIFLPCLISNGNVSTIIMLYSVLARVVATL